MPLQRQKRVVAVHAAAVIDHAHERDAAAPNHDFDVPRAGVDAVLDQFFHHRRRSLDDFSSRNLIRDNFGKKLDAAHAMKILDFRLPIAK